ncbi:hypothetical protein Nepgr_017505 [Nepenthes gracilis]|uniref:Uncharacterized protein n=1 Tax=Nepenthes gracilis TaxID=150966 RepID=A0AAD3SRP2_NEPGR|nr:hypothetical protein Nepgr_017505 [Nepenthes gracilis]
MSNGLMVSLCALPFAIDMRKESPTPLQRSKCHEPRCLFLACKLGKPMGCVGFRDSVSGNFKFIKQDNHGRSFDNSWRIKSLRAKGEDSTEDADGRESEDTLRATIKKRKKVLAMQREQLQQWKSLSFVGAPFDMEDFLIKSLEEGTSRGIVECCESGGTLSTEMSG